MQVLLFHDKFCVYLGELLLPTDTLQLMDLKWVSLNDIYLIPNHFNNLIISVSGPPPVLPFKKFTNVSVVFDKCFLNFNQLEFDNKILGNLKGSAYLKRL